LVAQRFIRYQLRLEALQTVSEWIRVADAPPTCLGRPT
jgi:hypothetical protein